MKKLRLDPESLRVDSFAPRADEDGRGGTVVGHLLLTVAETCYRQYTCGKTCFDAQTCRIECQSGGYACPDTYYVTCIPVCNTGEFC
ncbi:MAG TPA: hypothetical protein VF092_20900 [Longimicrobium sp.]